MARLPRLVVPKQAHLVLQRTLPGQALTLDEVDRQGLRELLAAAAQEHAVTIHAWALQAHAIALVATPERADSLPALMQAVARRHAAQFNRRHARRGTLWEGRYRAAVFDRDAWAVRAMLYVEDAGLPGWSSRAVHAGEAPAGRAPALQHLPAYWALGNTPFDREAAYRHAMQEGLGEATLAAIESALRGGWVLGSDAFVSAMRDQVARPVLPRARGRPRRGIQAVPD